MLKLKVNYWNMKPNMGVGLGAPQDRPSSQWKKVGTFVPPTDISPSPRVQHPDIMVEASSQTIRAIHKLSSLMISQSRLVFPPCADDVATLNITKDDLASLFLNPKTSIPVDKKT